MNAGDVIKSYLVSLGFDVDMSTYDKFNKALLSAEQKVEKHTEGLSKSFIKSGAVVTSALASIGFATIGLLDKIANADLEYKKFAMHMFMAKDAAKQMKIATDALGESLDDIAWMPELRSRYFDLMRQEKSMETPKDADRQLKALRDIQFEFTRMKVEMVYGMQWIGYHLYKYLEGPLKNVKESLAKMNDWIQIHMPDWSAKIAEGLAFVMNIIGSFIRLVGNVWDGLVKIWDGMPEWAQGIAVALGVAFAPISPMIKIISLLLVLLEDFFGYLDGRKSSTTLAPIWSALVWTIDKIVRGLVAASVLVANIFESNVTPAGQRKSFSQNWDDAVNAYNSIPGFQGPDSKIAAGVQNYKDTVSAGNSQAFVPSLSSGSSSTAGDLTFNVGGVTVNVGGSKATPEEIHGAVMRGVGDGAKSAMQIRQVARP